VDTQEWVKQHPSAFFLILFPVLWVGVLTLVGRTTGWAALARRFRAQMPFSGELWSWQSAQIRSWLGGYNNCLLVGANPQGLFLAMMIPFRFGHPSLFIPWFEVSRVSRGKWLQFPFVELQLGREDPIPLRMNERLAARIQLAAGSSWPGKPLA